LFWATIAVDAMERPNKSATKFTARTRQRLCDDRAKYGGAVPFGRWSCPAGRREAGASDFPPLAHCEHWRIDGGDRRAWAAAIVQTERTGEKSKMVRLILSDDPKQFMAEYPHKVFAVIGPFESHHDRLDLQAALRLAVMEHNKKRRTGRLSLSERS
jgi:hypothetical protein